MAMLTSCHSTRTVVKGSDANGGAIVVPGGGDNHRMPDTSKLSADRKKLIEEASTWFGTPYLFGGEDYSGADCSGFVMEVYRKALGIKLPRTSRKQQQFCLSISRDALTVGDLLFFCTGSDKSRVSHVAMYIGDGRMMHATRSKGVTISDIDERYYVTHYYSSGHVARSADRTDSASAKRVKKSASVATPVGKNPVVESQRQDLNRAVEERIDSIYSGFLD